MLPFCTHFPIENLIFQKLFSLGRPRRIRLILCKVVEESLYFRIAHSAQVLGPMLSPVAIKLSDATMVPRTSVLGLHRLVSHQASVKRGARRRTDGQAHGISQNIIKFHTTATSDNRLLTDNGDPDGPSLLENVEEEDSLSPNNRENRA